MIIGYQVMNTVTGEHWNDRPSFEILSERTAIQEFKDARESGVKGWLLSPILPGDIEKPTFEYDLLNTDDQYKCIGISTGHLTPHDIEQLRHLAARDDFQMVMERDTGFMVKLHEESEYFADDPYSDNLLGILMSVHQAGYRLVEFDSDATIMPDMEFFE